MRAHRDLGGGGGSVAKGFTCAVEEQYRSACADGEYRNTGYCVLHYPSQDKNMDEFGRNVKKKHNKRDFDFRGVWFPSTWKDFSSYEFDGKVDFSGATFKCADFQGATFNRDAVFTSAAFCATCDEEKRTDFRRATFKEEAYFREVHFTGYTDFYRAHFLGAVRFIGAENEMNEEFRALFPAAGRVSFNRALIDNPELFSFDTVKLRSSWFVGVDARKFRFTHVQWYGLPGGPKGCIDNEISILTNGKCGPGVGTPHSLLEQTCRELHINCEESREYTLANEFHYWSMEAQRKKPGEAFGLIPTLYWAMSGYGVKPWRALSVLLMIFAAFAVLYILIPSSPFSVFSTPGGCESVECIGQAATYSLSTLARLKSAKPELSPDLFALFVTVEGILGPLQIALLALAIRRKVMR